MIKLSQLSLQRGHQLLLEQADLSLHAGYKVGIIGANGAGKSSLFKLLLGELHADSGELFITPGWRLAHMAQEVEASECSALDYVLDGDQLYRQLEQAMQEADSQGQHQHLGELHAQFQNIDGYSAPARAAVLLDGLGFSASAQQQAVRSFSGGWRIRLNLARALMCPSDLLLLDEPTNHLDLDATLWLEQWLRQYPGTLLLISHDRDFLDNVVDHIVCFEQRKTQLYRGNYTAFELARAERLAQQQALYEGQQRQIAHMEDFIRRFKAKASKARQAQSRIKALERMERISAAHVDTPFSFSFATSDKLSSPLLSLDQAELGYQQGVISQLKLILQPGQRIGLLGPNGAGKSTLIKTLVGELPLLSGQRQAGEHLQIGYFAQHTLEALDLNASPALHLQRLAPQLSDQQVRDFLGSFGFFGDRVFEQVGIFSGGEKARLALALIAWQKPNLLLMDEPTNHLDLEVRHALMLALQDFEGALVLVSHDRALLRACVDTFLLVADGQVSEFEGDLEDYQRWLSQRQQQLNARSQDNASKGEHSAQQRKERKRQEAAIRQQLRPLRQQLEKAEASMQKLQQQLDQLNEQLADPSLYEDSRKQQLKQTLAEQQQVQQRLAETEESWLALTEQLEHLETELQTNLLG